MGPALGGGRSLAATPSSPPSTGEERWDWVTGGGRRNAALARARLLPTSRLPPGPTLQRAALSLAPHPLPETCPLGGYRAGAAGGCPCCAQPPEGLPHQPCLFTRKGSRDRAVPGTPGKGTHGATHRGHSALWRLQRGRQRSRSGNCVRLFRELKAVLGDPPGSARRA